jgi:hypothetical protein
VLARQDQELQCTSLIDGAGMSQSAEPETSRQVYTLASLPNFHFQGIPTLASKRTIHQMAESQTFASSDSLHGTNGCQQSSRWSASGRQNQSFMVLPTGNLSAIGAFWQSVEMGKSVSRTAAITFTASGVFSGSVELVKSAPSLGAGHYFSVNVSGSALFRPQRFKRRRKH